MSRWSLAFIMLLVVAPLKANDASVLRADVKIGTDVQNHALIGEADSFPANTRELVGWTKISGVTKPAQIIHIWKLNGKKVSTIPLKATNSSYRTFSRKTVTASGTYTLEVLDVDGNVIGSKDVQVKAR